MGKYAIVKSAYNRKDYGNAVQESVEKSFRSCSAAVVFLTFGEYIMETVNLVICIPESTQQLAIKLSGFGLMCGFLV